MSRALTDPAGRGNSRTSPRLAQQKLPGLAQAEVSGPERTANTQVRACLLDRSSDCSHALTHATRRPLPEVLVDDPTMAAETASCQRGRGFAERLAALRQDTPVEIKLRGLRCRPFDRSPLAKQQRPPAIKRVDSARHGADHSGVPHVGLLATMSMMRRRNATEVRGWPGGRQGSVQWPAIRRRCQRSRVSGVTSQPARCRRGRAAAIAPSRARSSLARAARLFCRCRTVSWWRSTMISRSFECPERTAKRANDTRNRYRTRHMGPRIASVAPVEGATTEFRPATDSQHAAHHAWSAHTTAFSGTHSHSP